MTQKEYLLTCLSEECAEVTKACSKSIRFGLNSFHPNGGPSNRKSILDEFYDIVAIIELLKDGNYLDEYETSLQEELKSRKKAKLIRYMREVIV